MTILNEIARGTNFNPAGAFQQARVQQGQLAADARSSQLNDLVRQLQITQTAGSIQDQQSARDTSAQAEAAVQQLGAAALSRLPQGDPDAPIIDSLLKVPEGRKFALELLKSKLQPGVTGTTQALAALRASKDPRAPIAIEQLESGDPEQVKKGLAEAMKIMAPRKPGTNITLPDGTQIAMGGDMPGVGPEQLTAPTKNKLQDTIVSATDSLSRLDAVAKTYDDRFLRLPGKFQALKIGAKDFVGMDVTPEEEQFFGDFSEFAANTAGNLSLLLNQLSGAAISPKEYERLAKAFPTTDDKPIEFKRKLLAGVKQGRRAILRANWALTNGIGVQSVEQLEKLMPLEGIDRVYEDRVNAIWQDMGASEATKAQAVMAANQEFGLAGK